jgi:hypothetical protein
MDGSVLKQIQLLNWLLIAALSASVWLGISGVIGEGVLIGGIIAAGSFSLMKRDLTRLFEGPPAEVKRRYFVRYYFRLIVLAGVLFWLVKHYEIHILGMLAGLSVVLLSILVIMVSRVKDSIFR